jgi:hypothetical protein
MMVSPSDALAITALNSRLSASAEPDASTIHFPDVFGLSTGMFRFGAGLAEVGVLSVARSLFQLFDWEEIGPWFGLGAKRPDPMSKTVVPRETIASREKSKNH